MALVLVFSLWVVLNFRYTFHFPRLDMTGTKFLHVLFKKMLATVTMTSKITVTWNEIVFLTFISPLQFFAIWWLRDPGPSYLVASPCLMVSAFPGYIQHMVKERLEKAHLLLNCLGPEAIHVTSKHFPWSRAIDMAHQDARESGICNYWLGTISSNTL